MPSVIHASSTITSSPPFQTISTTSLLGSDSSNSEQAFEKMIEDPPDSKSDLQNLPQMIRNEDLESNLFNEASQLLSESQFWERVKSEARQEVQEEQYLQEEHHFLEHVISRRRTLLKQHCSIEMYKTVFAFMTGHLSHENYLWKYKCYEQIMVQSAIALLKDLFPFQIPSLNKSKFLLIMEANLEAANKVYKSAFYFGHTGTNLIEQEVSSGQIVFADLLSKEPAAKCIPVLRYEDVYRSPWAKTLEYEEAQRTTMQVLGRSFKKEPRLFILIYLLALLTFTDQEVKHMEIPSSDIELIMKSYQYISIVLKRYLKNLFGVKVGMGHFLTYNRHLQNIKEGIKSRIWK